MIEKREKQRKERIVLEEMEGRMRNKKDKKENEPREENLMSWGNSRWTEREENDAQCNCYY